MHASTVAVWSLMVTALILLAWLRRLLETLSAGLSLGNFVDAANTWKRIRIASYITALCVFMLFIEQVVNQTDGYTIPLNSVYGVNMGMLVQYMGAVQILDAQVVAVCQPVVAAVVPETVSVHNATADQLLNRLSGCQDMVQGLLAFNGFAIAAVTITRVDWKGVKEWVAAKV